MAFGIAMNGLEERILHRAKEVAHIFDEITYVEIGVGEGATLTAIAHTLRSFKKRWRAIGIELPNGYSFNRNRTEEIAKQRDLKLNFVTPNCSIVHPPWHEVTVYFKDSQSLLTEFWQEPIHFALIDGCHGKPCVILDFLALDAFMVRDSVMMFHDISREQVGQEQPHCQSGIDVIGACYELGLLTASGVAKRNGWAFTEILGADRTSGGWDMGIFTKVK
jgi:hypothetical protein